MLSLPSHVRKGELLRFERLMAALITHVAMIGIASLPGLSTSMLQKFPKLECGARL